MLVLAVTSIVHSADAISKNSVAALSQDERVKGLSRPSEMTSAPLWSVLRQVTFTAAQIFKKMRKLLTSASVFYIL
jgi:hypothetical protein